MKYSVLVQNGSFISSSSDVFVISILRFETHMDEKVLYKWLNSDLRRIILIYSSTLRVILE